MKETWIDFKALRSKLNFEEVLKHYDVEVKRKGNQYHGYCPLPKHQGKRNSPSFSANLEKGIFQCFGCGAKGNLLDFAVLMEHGDPKDGAKLKEVALALQKRFCLHARQPEKEKPKPKPGKELPVVVNEPLDFALKDLDAEHPYLLGRGFTPETIERFGLGFCSRGFFKGRVSIPLNDRLGQLIGYAGRVVDDSEIAEDNPRYKLPGKRERDGKLYEFRKTLFLYNGFRFKTPLDDVIVVEGYTGVWWLDQNGLPYAVATMGADCSEQQAELIISLVKPFGRVWLMPDGNDAGKRCAETILRLVSPYRFVRWVKLVEGKQPTDFTAPQLKKCFAV